MKTKLSRLLITIAASVGAGVLATAVIASGQNGYTAGFIALPILILEALVCLALFIIGVALIAKDKLVGFYLLLAVLVLPIATVGSALLAKKFEIGAYRVEPMEPIIPPTANKIIFKKGITDVEVQQFWRDVLSQTRPDGRGEDSLPGIQSISTSLPEDGHEVLLFSFFASASDEEKAAARQRILASPKVDQLLENVDTAPEDFPAQQTNTLNTNASPKRARNMSFPNDA